MKQMNSMVNWFKRISGNYISLLLLGITLIILGMAFYAPPTDAEYPNYVPAFPEARGWGATIFSTFGMFPRHDARARPVVIHQVTTTDDGVDPVPPGSLREALNACHPGNFDIIVFRTGGRIRAESGNVFTVPNNCRYLYIAGQTAPGGGITVTGKGINIGENTDHILMRYITIQKTGQAALTLRSRQFIADYISISWGGTHGGGGHNNATFGYRTSDDTTPGSSSGKYTVSNVLSGEPLGTDEFRRVTNWNPSGELASFHGNYLFGPSWRMPLMSTTKPGGGFTFANNIVYNWRDHASNVTHDMMMDWIANFHAPGPATRSQDEIPFRWRTRCEYNQGGCESSVHLAGNRNQSNDYSVADLTTPQWEGHISCNNTNDPNHWEIDCTPDNANVPEVYKRDIRFEEHLGLSARWPFEPVEITDAVLDSIMEWTGNSRGLACDGSWVRRRSEYDAQMVQNFYDRTGKSAFFFAEVTNRFDPDPDEFPEVEVPDAGIACVDSSGDGIPDEWFIAQGYDPNSPPSIDSVTVSGYLLFEHYLNGSDPNDPNPWGTGWVNTGFGEQIQLPTQPELNQNHPNPFNPTTSITFELDQGDHIKLSVYNIQGRHIATLADEYRSEGKHEVMFHAGNLSSGTYMYRLKTSQGIVQRRMTVLK